MSVPILPKKPFYNLSNIQSLPPPDPQSHSLKLILPHRFLVDHKTNDIFNEKLIQEQNITYKKVEEANEEWDKYTWLEQGIGAAAYPLLSGIEHKKTNHS